jgi:hypothetical protein
MAWLAITLSVLFLPEGTPGPDSMCVSRGRHGYDTGYDEGKRWTQGTLPYVHKRYVKTASIDVHNYLNYTMSQSHALPYGVYHATNKRVKLGDNPLHFEISNILLRIYCIEILF